MCFDSSEVLNWGQNPWCKSKEIDSSNDHGTCLWILFILTYFLKLNIPTWCANLRYANLKNYIYMYSEICTRHIHTWEGLCAQKKSK